MTFPRRDVMRATLTLALLGAFELALFWLFQFQVPQGNRDLIVFMLGQLSGFAGMGVAYWLGTSKSSSDKNEILATRPTGLPDDPVHVEDDTYQLSRGQKI